MMDFEKQLANELNRRAGLVKLAAKWKADAESLMAQPPAMNYEARRLYRCAVELETILTPSPETRPSASPP